MPNRQLTDNERNELFEPLFRSVCRRLTRLSEGDAELHWALRRKLYKELMHLERGKPMHRRRLKSIKRASQGGKCPQCGGDLPERGSVLDRIEAMKGYTDENTRLLCPICDQQIQVARGFM